MNLNRRTILLGSLGIAAATKINTALAASLPSTPLGDDPAAPQWPAEERFALWPQDPPGKNTTTQIPALTMNGPRGDRQLQVRGVITPEVSVYRAAKPNGSAILVCPGGGYSFLSVQNEGIDVARRFTPFGITVFVLTYRLPNEGWDKQTRVPLQDAQRAMRLVKFNAAKYKVNPDQIGVMGFSAGGHLASDLATAFNETCYSLVDKADKLSARPQFAALIYPVASLQDNVGHTGTRKNLLGENPSAELLTKHSPADQVTADTPPCFVMHAMDDKTVPVEASLAMIAGCRKAQVQVEAHLFEKGGHGFGFRASAELPVAQWPLLFERWMQTHI